MEIFEVPEGSWYDESSFTVSSDGAVFVWGNNRVLGYAPLISAIDSEEYIESLEQSKIQYRSDLKPMMWIDLTGKTCSICDAPAASFIRFDDGDYEYFCERCSC
jgi:hypothetical protein